MGWLQGTACIVALLGISPLGAQPSKPAQQPGPAPAPVEKPQDTPTDAQGDPLPKGARARLGTSRWRLEEPVRIAAVAPDGKSIVLSGTRFAVLMDLGTGREIRRWQSMVSLRALAFTPDGKTIVGADY